MKSVIRRRILVLGLLLPEQVNNSTRTTLRLEAFGWKLSYVGIFEVGVVWVGIAWVGYVWVAFFCLPHMVQ